MIPIRAYVIWLDDGGYDIAISIGEPFDEEIELESGQLMEYFELNTDVSLLMAMAAVSAKVEADLEDPDEKTIH